jgi:hypothetical protein
LQQIFDALFIVSLVGGYFDLNLSLLVAMLWLFQTLLHATQLQLMINEFPNQSKAEIFDALLAAQTR